ncbi:MAG: hypothetical protein SGARI_002691 [Bacillariaceae sp.]
MIYTPIPRDLCTNENINGGLTKTECPAGKTTLYLGSSACIKFDEEDYISMIYDVMAATSQNAMQSAHWRLNRDGDVCTWNGIGCDEKGKVESISFPLLGLQEHNP